MNWYKKASVELLYHHSPLPFDKFEMSGSSSSAIWGAGIYLSDSPENLGGWKQTGQNGFLYSVSFSGGSDRVLDITEPLSATNAKKIGDALGREISMYNGIPFLSIEKRFGSMANALPKMGYDMMVHSPAAQSSANKHYLCVNPSTLHIENRESV